MKDNIKSILVLTVTGLICSSLIYLVLMMVGKL
jgi:hypothetical protein